MAYVIADGTVVSVFYNGLGARIEERFTLRSGEEGKKSYTLFAESPHGLNEGDFVKAKGTLSVKTREYEDKNGETRTAADVVINGTAEVQTPADDGDTPY